MLIVSSDTGRRYANLEDPSLSAGATHGIEGTLRGQSEID
jgi:hypothetical protein